MSFGNGDGGPFFGSMAFRTGAVADHKPTIVEGTGDISGNPEGLSSVSIRLIVRLSPYGFVFIACLYRIAFREHANGPPPVRINFSRHTKCLFGFDLSSCIHDRTMRVSPARVCHSGAYLHDDCTVRCNQPLDEAFHSRRILLMSVFRSS